MIDEAQLLAYAELVRKDERARAANIVAGLRANTRDGSAAAALDSVAEQLALLGGGTRRVDEVVAKVVAIAAHHDEATDCAVKMRAAVEEACR